MMMMMIILCNIFTITSGKCSIDSNRIRSYDYPFTGWARLPD